MQNKLSWGWRDVILFSLSISKHIVMPSVKKKKLPQIYWPGTCNNHLGAYVCYLGCIQFEFQTSYRLFWCVSSPALVSAFNAGICLEIDHSLYRYKWCSSFNFCSWLCGFKQDCKVVAHTTVYKVFTFWIDTVKLTFMVPMAGPWTLHSLLHQVEYPHHFHFVGLLHTYTILLQEDTKCLLWKHSCAQRICPKLRRAVWHNISLMSSFSCGCSKAIISSLAH